MAKWLVIGVNFCVVVNNELRELATKVKVHPPNDACLAVATLNDGSPKALEPAALIRMLVKTVTDEQVILTTRSDFKVNHGTITGLDTRANPVVTNAGWTFVGHASALEEQPVFRFWCDDWSCS